MRRLVAAIVVLTVGCSGGDGPRLGDASATSPAVVVETTATPDVGSSAPAVPPSPSQTPTPRAAPTPAPSCADGVPLRWAIGQLLVPLATPDQLAAVAALGSRGGVGGVVLLGSPAPADLEVLERAADAGLPLLVGSDEEGGTVQRLAGTLGALPSARSMAETMRPRQVRRTFRRYGRGLVDVGVDVAFAPVVDVGGGPGIGSRAFSSRPRIVTRYARAVIRGYRDAGIVPVIKHFPGHGRASADSHVGFARTPSLDEMRRVDLLPFEALADEVDLVMVGHLLVPGLTPDVPASLSAAAVDGLLRGELGYAGAVITDALGMQAVAGRWPQPEAAAMALEAGVDLLMITGPEAAPGVRRHLVRAVRSGDIARERVDEALERSLALRSIDPCTLGR